MSEEIIGRRQINKVGDLVDHLVAAAEQGCTPRHDIFVRTGELGPLYRIDGVRGFTDQRGTALLIQLCPTPESY